MVLKNHPSSVRVNSSILIDMTFLEKSLLLGIKKELKNIEKLIRKSFLKYKWYILDEYFIPKILKLNFFT